jgi:hypothetical protein
MTARDREGADERDLDKTADADLRPATLQSLDDSAVLTSLG